MASFTTMINVPIQILDQLIFHTKPNSIERMNLKFLREGIPLCISNNSYDDEEVQFNPEKRNGFFF